MTFDDLITRLLSAFPEDVPIERIGLAEVIQNQSVFDPEGLDPIPKWPF